MVPARTRPRSLSRWLQQWPLAAPLIALVVLLLTWGREPGAAWIVIVAAVLLGGVIAAVHHAEVVAHWTGEPFGSLILAVAVTVIEVGLIVTMMISGGPEVHSLARDTVFAAVMITCNGIVGLSLWTGAKRFGLAEFNAEGAGASLAAVAAVSALSLVLPSFTLGAPGPQFSATQLAFAAVASLVIYVMFVITQNVRHPDMFLPNGAGSNGGGPDGGGPDSDGDAAPAADAANPVRGRDGWMSLALLVIALVGVVGLAKVASPAIETGLRAARLPQSFVGVVIALVVLAPEAVAAVRAARRNRVQISMNLALGSAMASIGLTIPVIAIAMIWLPGPLLLGLTATQIVLLTLTVAVGTLTVTPGRATRLQGGIHLVLLAAFVFLAINP